MSTSSHQRIVRGASAATIRWQGVDQDGDPADPGAVTVGVVRSDGSPVVPDGTTTTGTGTGERTRVLTLADTAQLDLLTATWMAGGQVVGTTTVEIVGGVYATVGEIRETERSLADVNVTPDDVIKTARAEVEAMFEQVCRQAFVPRFSVVELPVGRRPSLANLRAVRWSEAVEQPLNDAFSVNLDRLWSVPSPRVRYGVEHGLDHPPADIKRAFFQAVRRQIAKSKSAVDPRAMSFQTPTGEVQRFPTPGLGPWITGVPEIDEVLQRYVMPDVASSIRVTPTTAAMAPTSGLI